MDDQAAAKKASLTGSSDKVEHNYHDYSNEQNTGDVLAAASEGSNRSDQNFPVKLHYMLSELEADGLDDIVSWQPHGRCFVVHKQKEFVEKILPL
jgi:HSF-type DNA-binding